MPRNPQLFCVVPGVCGCHVQIPILIVSPCRRGRQNALTTTAPLGNSLISRRAWLRRIAAVLLLPRLFDPMCRVAAPLKKMLWSTSGESVCRGPPNSPGRSINNSCSWPRSDVSNGRCGQDMNRGLSPCVTSSKSCHDSSRRQLIRFAVICKVPLGEKPSSQFPPACTGQG
jgi:hypothetical protein